MEKPSGRLLKERRLEAGITQEDLAKKSGIGVRTIRNIEGGTKPSNKSIRLLAKALDIRYAALEGKEFNAGEVVQVNSMRTFNPKSKKGIGRRV